MDFKCMFFTINVHFNTFILNNRSQHCSVAMVTMKYTWILLCLHIIYCTVATATILSLPEKVHMNLGVRTGYYNGATTQQFDTLIQVDLVTCIEKCKRHASCEFVNYTRKLGLCYLISTPKPCTRRVDTQIGVVYANKTEWNLTSVPGECGYCVMYTECVTDSPTSHVCVTRGCGKPSLPPDSTKLGNMYNIDDKVNISCRTSDLSVVRVCQNDRTWSHDNFTCEIPTTTTTTTVPPLPSCIPLDGITYQTGVLSDSTTLSFYIGTQTFTRDIAALFCIKNCGRLVEILTMAKYNFLANIIETSSAYRDEEYFINGDYIGTLDKWFTDNGNEILKSMNFWTNDAAYDGSVPCLKLKDRVDDTDCNDSLRFICEEVVS